MRAALETFGSLVPEKEAKNARSPPQMLMTPKAPSVLEVSSLHDMDALPCFDVS